MPQFDLERSVDYAVNELLKMARLIGTKMDDAFIDVSSHCSGFLDLEWIVEALVQSGYHATPIETKGQFGENGSLQIKFSAPYPPSMFQPRQQFVVLSKNDLQIIVGLALEGQSERLQKKALEIKKKFGL